MPKKSVNEYKINSSRNLYLGIDGGGTKTQAVLINNRREIICEGLSGPSNPLRVGVEDAVSNIIKAVNTACDKAFVNPTDIISAILGLAGVRRADIRERVQQSFIDSLKIKKVEVLTDAEIALFGTTLGKAGLVIISGTGSICLGKDDKGNSAVAGGWGPIAGDEGGGISIAKQALRAIAKASDGRGKHTKLSHVGAEYFRASTPDDLIVAIYSPQMDNKKIAGFAKYVVETANKGDEIAIEILSVAGYELGLAALAVIKKLDISQVKIPMGTVGSIFKAGEILTNPLLKTVHSYALKAFLQKPKLNPANAAAVLAFENLNK
jgi:N-acetylglucosamine kinase-like BadF-type ATPase